MTRGRLIAAGAAVLVLAIVWYLLLLAPKSNQLSTAHKQLADAKDQETQLQSTLRRLQALAQQRPSRQAELERLQAAVPPAPDLAGFILSADKIALDAGVDWQSVSPAPPAPGAAGGPSTISMTIQVQGGFFQVLDYLNRIEDLDRVVVVDTLQLSTSDTDNPASPKLSVNLAARMFTTAPAAGSPTTNTTTPGAPGVTTTTAAGAATTVTTAAAGR